MSAKHTPGPWIVQSVPWQESLRVVGGANALDTVAGIISNADDAALIASAPDLLTERDALRAQVQELLEALEKIVIIATMRKADHRLCTLEIADAALAKVSP